MAAGHVSTDADSTSTTVHLTAIAAMDRNGVIGANGGMPWHLPADLRWFKNQTRGKPILMGRKTRESIGRALPGRRNFVMTRRANPGFDDCEIVRSLDDVTDAMDSVRDGAELMVIGGAEIYAMTLPRTSRLLITRIDAAYDGDTWFPQVVWPQWQLVDEKLEPAGETSPACRFQTFDRCVA